jgi:hypothetical protein
MTRLATLSLVGLLLVGCSNLPSITIFPDQDFSTLQKGRLAFGTLALATPPLNQVVFGPCTEEFGMPESRRGSCDLYYSIRNRNSPWVEAAAAERANSYPQEALQCQRTLGGVAECVPLSGRAHAPRLLAPNMGSN